MEATPEESNAVRVAVEGCGHGTIHAIYASVAESCKRKGWSDVDIVIVCGDFQAVRNAYDLNCASMPAKYLQMGDFHEYYSGKRTAPYLTLFLGGNHEASNHLFELYYGGWVAPNIYYLGAANVLRIGGLRIAGQSGIWKGHDFRKTHYERLPYSNSDISSIYHVREIDTRKLLQIRTQVDIGLSHDWPKGVEWYGDHEQLFRFKRHLENDAQRGQLGSIAAQDVLKLLRPYQWFSAHLHCKYVALVEHVDKPKKEGEKGSNDAGPSTQQNGNGNGHGNSEMHRNGNAGSSASITKRNSEEIDLDLEDESGVEPNINKGATAQPINQDEIELDLDNGMDAPAARSDKHNSTKAPLNQARAALPDSFRPPEPPKQPPAITNKTTRFLALDKCVPGRHFLQLLGIPVDPDVELVRPLKLEYDREWLAITRTFALDEPLILGNPEAQATTPSPLSTYPEMIEKRRLWVDDNFSDVDLVIPENFEITAPVYDGGNWNLEKYRIVREVPNPQTARYCKMLDIPNAFEISEKEIDRRLYNAPVREPLGEETHKSRGRDGFRGGRGGRGNGYRGGRGGNGFHGGRGGGGGGGFRGRGQPY